MKPHVHQRDGAATLELAVVMPLVLLLAFACVDFGRVVHAYVIVSNAARCGAEEGSMNYFTNYTRSSWETNVKEAVSDEMQGLHGFDSTKLQTTITTATDSDGLFRITLQATYPFQTIVNWPGVPSQVTLSRSVVMRQNR
jgi:Flp pilus assembly protein TadG